MLSRRDDPQVAAGKANPWWTAAALLSAALALAVGAWALIDQYLASRPVGEGELFATEVTAAAAEYQRLTETGTDPDVVIRQIRNRLEVESVAVVDASGVYRHSTSAIHEGRTLSGYLAGALSRGTFAAIAQPITGDVTIDGVVEWRNGDVLYRVFMPTEDGGGLAVEYDVSALLARRARQAAVEPLNLAAGGASIILLAGTALLLIARQGAQRRATQATIERHYLEQRSTELENHNRALDEARSRAERALDLAEETNRVRSEFVLMINHELRTPLTSIVSGSELLADKWESLSIQDRQGLLTDVVADGRRLKDLITQMLVVARIENRGLQYQLRPVPADSLRSQLETLSPRTGLWPEGQEVPVLLTDLDTLVQLLGSLSDNARTHGAGQVDISVADGLPFHPVVEVGTRPAMAAYFLIRDDGPGIDSEFVPRIFEKFEKRGHTSGTGLGLYLAKLMVEGLEGSISVATGSEGTTMAVGVPRWARSLRVAVRNTASCCSLS